jgi:polar amino acid transport system permease protein
VNALEPYLPLIWDGYLTTLQVLGLSVLVCFPTAFVLGSARSAHTPLLRVPAGAVVEFLRGTSAIVQLFWVYFALPLLPLGIKVSPTAAAVSVLGLNAGAYAAEVVRGAIQAVPRGQIDAAIALDWTPFQRLRKVVLPQAIPAMIPPFANIAVDIMKGTALVGFVFVHDLTFSAEAIRAQINDALAVYGVVLLIYFATAVVISLAFRGLESTMPLRRVERRAARDSRRARREGAGSVLLPSPPLERVE